MIQAIGTGMDRSDEAFMLSYTLATCDFRLILTILHPTGSSCPCCLLIGSSSQQEHSPIMPAPHQAHPCDTATMRCARMAPALNTFMQMPPIGSSRKNRSSYCGGICTAPAHDIKTQSSNCARL